MVATDYGAPYGRRNDTARARLSTPGVLAVPSFETIFDPDVRTVTVTAVITTVFGESSVQETLG